ncbi:DUF6702 family protein [Faecalibacter rhinopitheci]|uniref:Uncharacterized protein n=1 Tax=Faecalibacter rhinopitheci TaxID=2779678 RepID=A0A8J7G918_9FLAO|nr:DUF6702 family protein [Faecalibacter rhinopitheci]MBF0597635.1 hypothetical protein [Faecalibacter rhinopitheci]MBQ0146993.1 hypothetical protein [Candidatus Onthonaster equi]
MKMWKYILSLVLIVTSINLFAQQQFNTSNTNIDYELETGTLNITSRLYTVAIEKAVGEKTTNKSSFDAKLKNYINNKVDLKINGKPVNVSYYGFQTNEQTTRIYLKVEKLNDISSLDIRLALLMDTYSDQQNFMKIDIKNNRKSFVIRKDTEVVKINF